MNREKGETPWRIREAGERDRAAVEAVVMDAFDACLPRMDCKPFPMRRSMASIYCRPGQ